MGEVHDPQDAEDQRQPYGHEGIEQPGDQAVNCKVNGQCSGHGLPTRTGQRAGFHSFAGSIGLPGSSTSTESATFWFSWVSWNVT
jgi:hypothetical protein